MTVNADADLQARINGGLWIQLEFCAARLQGNIEVDHAVAGEDGVQLELHNRGRPLAIDCAFLYRHIFSAHLRDVAGKRSNYLGAVHQLNANSSGC